MSPRVPLVGFMAVLGLSACSGMAAPSPAYHPVVRPAAFRSSVTNPYFPLAPGTQLHYRVSRRGVSWTDDWTVLPETKQLLGIASVGVKDIERRGATVLEATTDWYAQDARGTVWYFGEETRETGRNGRVTTAGSWLAGVHGGLPGILMPAAPRPGGPYRQEYLRGEAEDMARIVAVHDTVTVPYGRFTDCVRTTEWSPLERGHETKWYARGIGFVRAVASDGEVTELLSVTRATTAR